MTKKTLVRTSLVADLLDVVVVGQVPVLSWEIDLPVIVMHVVYAGPIGLATLLELVPVVGTLPMFTIAAMSHKEHERGTTP